MTKKSTSILILVAIVAVAAGVFAMRTASTPAAVSVDAGAANLAASDGTAPPAGPPASYTSPVLANKQATPPHDQEEGEDAEAKLLEGIQKLETKFQAEPMASAWAMENERMISGTFAPDTLKSNAAPAPLSHQEQCRSSTCRITATYKSEMDAEVAQLNLLAGISPSLPRAVMGQVPGNDGSVQLVVYASVGNGGPPPQAEHE
jgi:hypothetical protein